MTTVNREDLDKLLANLSQAALNTEPGSEEMDVILQQIGIVTDKINALDEAETNKAIKEAEIDVKSREVEIKEANSHPTFDKAMKVVEVIAIPVGVCIADKTFTTYWTKMVCRWEKDETFRTSAGRCISNLFKFKK